MTNNIPDVNGKEYIAGFVTCHHIFNSSTFKFSQFFFCSLLLALKVMLHDKCFNIFM